MPFEPISASESFRMLCDHVGYSHRTIDARRRANGDRRVSVRVTQAQYDDLAARAKDAHLTVAEFVRLVLGVYDVTDTPVY